MTKEEKIKEAWELFLKNIASFNYVEGYLSENGWMPMNLLSDSIRIKLASKVNTYELKDDFVRPISLNGIEHNNGWIKIEIESDIKICNDEMWVKHNDGDILTLFASKNYLLKNCTHYKVIEKPKPPIY